MSRATHLSGMIPQICRPFKRAAASHVRCTWCAWWCDSPAGSVFGSRHAIQGVIAYEMLPHRQLLQSRPAGTQFIFGKQAMQQIPTFILDF